MRITHATMTGDGAIEARFCSLGTCFHRNHNHLNCCRSPGSECGNLLIMLDIFSVWISRKITRAASLGSYAEGLIVSYACHALIA
jgi:hypothetical protein